MLNHLHDIVQMYSILFLSIKHRSPLHHYYYVITMTDHFTNKLITKIISLKFCVYTYLHMYTIILVKQFIKLSNLQVVSFMRHI